MTESTASICTITIDQQQLADHPQRSPHLWIVDAGASHHICFEKSLFKTFEKYKVPVKAGTSITSSIGCGQVDLTVDGHTLTLHGVLYVPQLRFNLLSTECLRRESFIGYDSLPNTLYYGEDEEIITSADSSSGIPIIDTNPYSEGSSTFYHEVTTRPISLDLAHRRLGHISEARVRALANGQAEGLKLIPRHRSHKCGHCVAWKIRTLPHPRTQPTFRRPDRPTEVLRLDLLQGPCTALGPGS